MIDLCKLILCAFAGLFRSRAELEAEILVLRHQLNVRRRKSPGRLAFSSIDRLVFAGMYALAPNILDALKIVKPETVLRWHRAGFRAYCMTAKEYQMLELLALRKGTTLTKESFLNHLYGGMNEPDMKIIDVFICRLRKKLANASGGKDSIETVWGRGYVIREPSENAASVPA